MEIERIPLDQIRFACNPDIEGIPYGPPHLIYSCMTVDGQYGAAVRISEAALKRIGETGIAAIQDRLHFMVSAAAQKAKERETDADRS